jgi:hypothetical protein
MRCGRPIEQRKTGRPRQWCSHSCRQLAYHRRRFAWPVGFEDADEALTALVAVGRQNPHDALLRIVSAWPLAA